MTTNDGDKAEHSGRRNWSWSWSWWRGCSTHIILNCMKYIRAEHTCKQTQTRKVPEIHTEKKRCLKWVSLLGRSFRDELSIELSRKRNEKELNYLARIA